MNAPMPDTSRHTTPGIRGAASADLAALACALGVGAIIQIFWPLPTAGVLGLLAVLIGAFALVLRYAGASAIVMPAAGAGGLLTGLAALVLVVTLGDRADQPAPTGPQDSPSMQAAREQAKRVRCTANLRTIGQALHIYAVEWDGRLPAHLFQLEEEGRLRAKELQSPLDPDADNTCDYSYAPDIRIHGARRNWLLAWGDPAYTSNQGASVLYVDGHAEFLEQQEFDEAMERFLREYMEKYNEALAVIDPY